ncbi:unnamed protein product [Boreogadus saida]
MMMLQLLTLVLIALMLQLMLHCTGVGLLVVLDDGCEAGCRCKADGMLRTADCSDLGLTETPSNINVLTTYLDLSMNDFSRLPAGSFSRFQALRELHLDANALASVPRGSFKGLRALRFLWMDDNGLPQVPVAALASLPALQALSLALNHISHLPDLAFHTMRQLLVLHLHNNQIGSLAEKCFEGLPDLETLKALWVGLLRATSAVQTTPRQGLICDMSSNTLDSFPTAIRALPSLRDLNLHNNHIKTIPDRAFIGNPSLERLNLHLNPVQSIGENSFQRLPRLLKLSISGTHIAELPGSLCEDLPQLRQLDLSHNRILSLPCFTDCRNMQKIDLSFNPLSHLPRGEELSGLTRLLAGAQGRKDPLPPHLLPRFRYCRPGDRLIAAMPLGFQRCVRARVRPGKPYPRCPCRREDGLPLQMPPWTAHLPVWAAVVFPSVAVSGLALTLGLRRGSGCRTSAARRRLLLAALLSLRLLGGLGGLWGAGLALAEGPHGAAALPGLQAPCWGPRLLFLPPSQGCLVLLMAAAAWEHRSLRATRSAAPGVGGRLLGAASAVLVAAVVLGGSAAALVLTAACVRVVLDEGGLDAGSVRTGRGRCWGPDAARVALSCAGYLLLAAFHGLVLRRRRRDRNTATQRDRNTATQRDRNTATQRDRNTATQRPWPALGNTHAVTCLLLANAALSAAEALLWLAEGSSVTGWTAPILQPAGGAPALLLLSALPAVLDPLLYALLHLQGAEPRRGRPGDRKH